MLYRVMRDCVNNITLWKMSIILYVNVVCMLIYVVKIYWPFIDKYLTCLYLLNY